MLQSSRFSERYLWLSCFAPIPALSIMLGITYAIQNTDPHHWGFIAGTAMDFISGRRLFSEVYIQYGVGQPILFYILDGLFRINYTSIGIVTVAAYAAFLILLYSSLLQISSPRVAIFLVIIVFLVHPYAIYPWPDYYAGLCICLFCFVIINNAGKEDFVASLLPSALLFIAFLFRSTYIFGIGFALCVSIVATLANRKLRSRVVYFIAINFSAMCLIFCLALYSQGHLQAWYLQAIGAATGKTYGVGLFEIIRLALRFLYPLNVRSLLIMALLLMNLYVAIKLLYTPDADKSTERQLSRGALLFLVALGIGGFVQVLEHFEMFRILNSGVALIIGAGYFLATYFDFRKTSTRVFSAGLLVGLLAGQFYELLRGNNNSIVWPLLETRVALQGTSGKLSKISNRYEQVDTEIFSGHFFEASSKQYYTELMTYLCDGHSDIVNTTMDSTLPYLCKGQRNALMLPFFSEDLLRPFQDIQLEKAIHGSISKNQLIVVDSTLGLQFRDTARLELLGSTVRPNVMRWMPAGPVSVYRLKSTQ